MTLVDTQVVALVLKVAPATVRSWAHRGKLERRGRDRRGRVLFALEDAEKLRGDTPDQGA